MARLGSVSVLAIFVCMAMWVSAAGAQVVVGQTIRAPFEPVQCTSATAYDEMQVTVADGASYTVPSTGLLTAWSTVAGPSGGQLGLKVYRPLGGLKFQIVGQDGPHPLLAGQRNTFPVAIPVLTGDIVGTAVPSNANAVCAFTTNLGGDFYRYNPGNSANGAVIDFGSMLFGTEERMNIEASLLPPPVITSFSPAAGPIKNATVTIAGANFATVTGVSFGGVPAKSFTVYSEGQIVAVAPDSSELTQVPIAITTGAGVTSSAQAFAYEGCKVPKLKGKKLKASKKAAHKRDCKIGKVKKLGDATAKTGEVVKQNPKPGKVLLPGTKIKVTLGGAR
jgi:hypothetical protein